ncbi:hypothetical protein K5Y32_12850 [Pantoea sp. DY-15]|uniref:hypothetical protein n=1 Tax=Pantoea sp. DY-15 TaxID=2871489 RepID=UPI001C945B53|nr:hypothetical protein [Pantoea sp. DY-15]MBY4888834.1 hypothetical protein [Pantoea sp. DY-15]
MKDDPVSAAERKRKGLQGVLGEKTYRPAKGVLRNQRTVRKKRRVDESSTVLNSSDGHITPDVIFSVLIHMICDPDRSEKNTLPINHNIIYF